MDKTLLTPMERNTLTMGRDAYRGTLYLAGAAAAATLCTVWHNHLVDKAAQEVMNREEWTRTVTITHAQPTRDALAGLEQQAFQLADDHLPTEDAAKIRQEARRLDDLLTFYKPSDAAQAAYAQKLVTTIGKDTDDAIHGVINEKQSLSALSFSLGATLFIIGAYKTIKHYANALHARREVHEQLNKRRARKGGE